MPMSPDGFLKRLRDGKAVNCNYRRGELIGMVAAWLHAGKYIVSWEECRKEDLHDDAAYLRDDVSSFATPEEVLAFVQAAGFPPEQFHP